MIFRKVLIYSPGLSSLIQLWHYFMYAEEPPSLKLEKTRRALDDFSQAIKLDPSYARAYHLRGLAYAILGDLARAFQDFDRPLEIDPEYAAAYHCRESVLSKPNHPDESCADFEMASHLMAMRLTDFNQKVSSDLEI